MDEKPTILIVGGSRKQRKTYQKLCADQGYHTWAVASGKEALKRADGGGFALALIDLKLKDISGLEVLKQIKSRDPDAECIVITARDSHESGIQALEHGAFNYLEKPIQAERLLISVERGLDKRDTERRLKGLEAFQHDIVNGMSEGIAIEDTGGYLTFLNPAACKLLGYSQEELLGKHWTTIIPDDQQDRVREVNRSRAEGLSSRYELEVERKGGERLPILVSGSPRFEEGEFVGTLAVFTDISRRVRAERQMKLLSAALESAANAVLIADDAGTIEWVNAAFTELTGYTKEEVVGQNTRILRSGHHPSEFYVDLWRTIKSGKPWQGRLINRKKNGKNYIEEQTITPVMDEGDRVAHYIAIKQDVTERTNTKRVLRRQLKELKMVNALAASGAEVNSEDELITQAVRILAESLYSDHVGVLLLDESQGILVTHPSYHGLDSEKEFRSVKMGEGIAGIVAQSGQPMRISDVSQVPEYIETVPRMRSELCVPLKIGERVLGVINVEDQNENAFTEDDQRLLSTFASQLATAIERVRLFEKTQRRAKELEALYQSGLTVTQELNPERMLLELSMSINELFSPDAFLVARLDPESERISIALALEEGERMQEVEEHQLSLDEKRGLLSWIIRHRQPLLIGDATEDTLPVNPYQGGKMPRSWLGVPMVVGDKLVGALSIQSFTANAFDERDRQLLELFANQVGVALENARLFSSSTKQASYMSLVNEVAKRTIMKLGPDELLQGVVQSIHEMFEYPDVMAFLVNGNHRKLEHVACASIYNRSYEVETAVALGSGGVISWVVDHGETVVVNDVTQDERYLSIIPETESELCVPLKDEGDVIGGINVESARRGAFSDMDVVALEALADNLVAGLQAAQLFDELQNRVAQLQAMRRIDRTISSSLDVTLMLDVLLREVKDLMGVDAADVLLYNPEFQHLEFAAAVGFRSSSVEGITIRLGESYAGKAILRRERTHIPDLSKLDPSQTQPLSFVGIEGFRGYAAMPLIAKGVVKGVLEVYHRSPLEPDSEWFEFLKPLSTQAAIAIDHMDLFEEMHRSNVELTQGYEKMLEGWASALELRDQETQGHSDRVTSLTLKIAEKMGISGKNKKYIKWGALLHDVGKMGIPDSILKKPGKLNDEEWQMMKKHPRLAFDLLSTNDHLKPALDIPRYHHEKWDGSGYPHGLKGEAIPLPARIFAVVDVWDALRSDRPYREAWSDERALAYIKEQSGKHFDPQVVDIFLDMIEGAD